jgi:ribose/xylose/arabinose/galactoside ABC-type transport system permease subunit
MEAKREAPAQFAVMLALVCAASYLLRKTAFGNALLRDAIDRRLFKYSGF